MSDKTVTEGMRSMSDKTLTEGDEIDVRYNTNRGG